MNELRWLAFAELAVASLLGSYIGVLLKQRDENLATAQALDKSAQ